jgi:hypothetical protein
MEMQRLTGSRRVGYSNSGESESSTLTGRHRHPKETRRAARRRCSWLTVLLLLIAGLVIGLAVWSLLWLWDTRAAGQEALALARNASIAQRATGYIATGQLISDGLVTVGDETCDASPSFDDVQTNVIGRSALNVSGWMANATAFFLNTFNISITQPTTPGTKSDVYVYNVCAHLRLLSFPTKRIGPEGWQTYESGVFVEVTQPGGIVIYGGTYNAGGPTLLPRGTRIVYGDYSILHPATQTDDTCGASFLVSFWSLAPSFPPTHANEVYNIDQTLLWGTTRGWARGERWVKNVTLDGTSAYLYTAVFFAFPNNLTE